MDPKPLIGIIFGLIILMIGALGAYSLDYLNNIFTAYLLIVLGLICLVEHLLRILR